MAVGQPDGPWSLESLSNHVMVYIFDIILRDLIVLCKGAVEWDRRFYVQTVWRPRSVSSNIFHLAMAVRTFNPSAVHKAFSASLSDGEDGADVGLEKYILGYKEICSFFDVLGTVFGFVASDVHTKIEIMEKLREGPLRDNYTSVRKMMRYETENKLVRTSNYVSGSRTLLRLHRGLDFIRSFLQKMSELEPSAKAAQCCQQAYADTLAPYHSWLIRKGAHAAMYALPTKDVLLLKMCGTEEGIKEAVAMLPEMLLAAEQAYNRTEKLYDEFKLKDLP